MNIHEKELNRIKNIFQIFKTSGGEVRPHFLLAGPSGSGKTYSINQLCEDLDLPLYTINAAQVTKEGISGLSLSKALAGLYNMQGPRVVFVDEFDKLFISNNESGNTAHESTLGVQNEFLTVLESDTASVMGDYGKYNNIPMDETLFVFAGAFNNQHQTLDSLRLLGVKTEFLGRVGLVVNLDKLDLDTMIKYLKESPLFDTYSQLYDLDEEAEQAAIDKLANFIEKNYEHNTIGMRFVNTSIHQYFINDGDLEYKFVKDSVFTKKLSFGAA